jgi:Zn-dependent protease/predicted transcriptional regulator
MEMNGFRVATVRGIPIRIHITFLLVLPLLAFGFGRAFQEAARLAGIAPGELRGNPYVWGLGIALALFLSVLVHELAHSLYALRKGGRVRDITLLMIGGVSQISEQPREARHEAVMALVGPVTSLLIGGVLYILSLAAQGIASFNLQFALFYLASLNLFLGFFNLLPAFPMDGGRILRSVLTTRLGLVRATRIAAGVGKAFAFAFGVLGFVSFNMLLLLIAFFVWMGAEAETRQVLVKALLGQLRVRDLMTTRLPTVPEDATLYDTAERMLRQQALAAVVVATDGQPLGVVTAEIIQRVAVDQRTQRLVRDVSVPAPALAPDDEAGKVLRLTGELGVPLLAVVDGGQLIGTISQNDITRGLKLRELEASQRHEGRWVLDRRELRV